jgi:hypothetical protein
MYLNNILIYISNKVQRYTVYFIWKLLYMFRVVFPPITRSANNCIYNIWYLSERYCYLPSAADSSNDVTNTRCCRYSCLRSWWWVEVPPETCRAVSRYKLCNVAYCWICSYIGILLGAHPILHISRIKVNYILQYLVSSTNYEAPHYVVFSTSMLPPPS